VLLYYASLRSEFSVVMSATISAFKRYSVRLCFILFLVGFMSDLRYLPMVVCNTYFILQSVHLLYKYAIRIHFCFIRTRRINFTYYANKLFSLRINFPGTL
jgi:hypothetical protein